MDIKERNNPVNVNSEKMRYRERIESLRRKSLQMTDKSLVSSSYNSDEDDDDEFPGVVKPLNASI